MSLFSSFPNLSTVNFREMAEEAPELKRDSTMTVTAKVRERSKAREHRKIFTPKVPCNAIESVFISLPQEKAQFLEEQGKVHEDAKTRAQQRELEESEEEDAASKLKRTSTTAQVRIRVRKLF